MYGIISIKLFFANLIADANMTYIKKQIINN